MGKTLVQNQCDKIDERKYYKHKNPHTHTHTQKKKTFKTGPLEGIGVKFFFFCVLISLFFTKYFRRTITGNTKNVILSEKYEKYTLSKFLLKLRVKLQYFITYSSIQINNSVGI